MSVSEYIFFPIHLRGIYRNLLVLSQLHMLVFRISATSPLIAGSPFPVPLSTTRPLFIPPPNRHSPPLLPSFPFSDHPTSKQAPEYARFIGGGHIKGIRWFFEEDQLWKLCGWE